MVQSLVKESGHKLIMEKKFSKYLNHPICLEFPLWLEETAWAEHIPFAMFIMAKAKPKIFVELGSYRGVSYCAFCQATKLLQSETKCYAVDTWKGDSHAGFLESDALTKLRSHHDPLYSEFSTLIQLTFDEALSSFENGSVDLLHIDGFHTYEAVNHDFETWLPKMSDKGIILFHDTAVLENDFGVWKFWAEVSVKYPNFNFLHGNGLGVLAVGKDIPKDIEFLFNLNEEQTYIVRNYFYKFGFRIGAVESYQRRENELKRLQKFEQSVLNSRIMRILYFIKDKGLMDYIKSHPRFSK